MWWADANSEAFGAVGGGLVKDKRILDVYFQPRSLKRDGSLGNWRLCALPKGGNCFADVYKWSPRKIQIFVCQCLYIFKCWQPTQPPNHACWPLRGRRADERGYQGTHTCRKVRLGGCSSPSRWSDTGIVWKET